MICNLYLSVEARKIEQTRPWDTLACSWGVQQQTDNSPLPSPPPFPPPPSRVSMREHLNLGFGAVIRVTRTTAREEGWVGGRVGGGGGGDSRGLVREVAVP